MTKTSKYYPKYPNPVEHLWDRLDMCSLYESFLTLPPASHGCTAISMAPDACDRPSRFKPIYGYRWSLVCNNVMIWIFPERLNFLPLSKTHSKDNCPLGTLKLGCTGDSKPKIIKGQGGQKRH